MYSGSCSRILSRYITSYYCADVIIINGDGGCSFLAAYRRAYGSSRSAWSKGRRPRGAVLHSSCEPGELSQCSKHDDSTINIVVVIIIIIIIIDIHIVILDSEAQPSLMAARYAMWVEAHVDYND